MRQITDVRALPRIEFDQIRLTEVGETFYEMCLCVHASALRLYYPDWIPDPNSSCGDDEILHLWWECDGWAIIIRIDADLWDLA